MELKKSTKFVNVLPRIITQRLMQIQTSLFQLASTETVKYTAKSTKAININKSPAERVVSRELAKQTANI